VLVVVVVLVVPVVVVRLVIVCLVIPRNRPARYVPGGARSVYLVS